MWLSIDQNNTQEGKRGLTSKTSRQNTYICQSAEELWDPKHVATNVNKTVPTVTEIKEKLLDTKIVKNTLTLS